MAIESSKNLLDPSVIIEEEVEVELSLRPSDFDGYMGQGRVKDNLKVYVEAAKQRGDVLDHVLIYGPPGLGKTTLAGILAKEMGADLRVSSGPAMARTGDLASILTNLKKGDVLFIDEIHRLSKTVEEVLYSAMEDFVVDIIVGKGPVARTVRLNLEAFTLVGATTKIGNISSPLRDRFGVIERLDFYSRQELESIIKNTAGKLDLEIDNETLSILAGASRGTPRVANRMLRRVRDFALVNNAGKIDRKLALDSLKALGIDENGLDKFDRYLLSLMVKQFAGKPVGLDTLAAATSEDRETIEEVCEPYLLRLGLIEKTAQGRRITLAGKDYLKK